MEDIIKTKNPVIESENICKDFSTYIRSTFVIRDKEYNDLFKQRLNELEGSLYKGPYLCSDLPFEISKTINQCIADGEMDEDFIKLHDVSPDRALYAHQYKSIKLIESGRNAVITTGTGSGKTECFFYPIIDTIMKEKRKSPTSKGIRAIMLFPINALVNDQIERLRDLLSTYPNITFGFFTGETCFDEEAYKKKFHVRELPEHNVNELILRKEMLDNPPDILFTNYSMLEYLLLRPDYNALLNKETLKNWRFVVLDEAHTYKGALGIEISLLLKRLVGISGHEKQRYILTSATLGSGRQDLPKIIDFASKLTSKQYCVDDVIFAKRHSIPILDNYTLEVDPQDYIALHEKMTYNLSIDDILKKYISLDSLVGLSPERKLYEFLIQDKNVKMLYSLSKKAGLFHTILLNFNSLYRSKVTTEELVALCELVTEAKSDKGLNLFNIKYHMFIKAPDGAYITIGKYKNLSLKKCVKIGDQVAFKIGICPNCGMPFIIGITDGGYLTVDDNINIDEESNESIIKAEYYLMANCLTEDEIKDIEADKEHYKKYIVCSKCGKIYSASDAKAKLKKCSCGEDYSTVLYKYEPDKENVDEDGVYTNNLRKCPICDYTTKSGGVVLGFHIGKDRATSLLSQILYKNMDYSYKKLRCEKNMLTGKSIYKYDKKLKQFVTFSDSRQQASTFDTFLDYNNNRFLKMRLINEVLKQNNYNPIKYKELIYKLSEIIGKELNEDDPIEYAEAAALWELLNLDSSNSCEGKGLFAFKLDLSFLDKYKDNILNTLSQNGFGEISYDNFLILMQICFYKFRTAPAIYHNLMSLDNELKDKYLSYRKYPNYFVLQSSSNNKSKGIARSKNEASFLPINNKQNKETKYIEKALKYDHDKAIKLMTLLWQIAESTGEMFEIFNNCEYRIKPDKYILESYKKLKFYRCKKCHKLTIYNINDKCPEKDCDGELELIDPDVVLKENFYRNEYLNKIIEPFVTKEHTGQIKSSEAKKFQDDFRNGDINVLNSTTTFEMGIDIGGLSTVFMRNIPPTPANYVQRAGRAGRRIGTSAFILTFCSISSHDYTFFVDPTIMMDGLIDPPIFDTDNEKILLRHIAATALSFYFKMYPECTTSIYDFVINNHKDKFLDYIKTKPLDLGNYIDNFVLKNGDLFNKYSGFKWINAFLNESESSLSNMANGVKSEYDEYEKAEQELGANASDALKKQYEIKKNNLKSSTTFIKYLSNYGVIPGYGFPVDNVSLLIYDNKFKKFLNNYVLERNLNIAISEYAPGSEIIVDKHKYTSRYVYMPYNGVKAEKYEYVECDECHAVNIFKTHQEPDGHEFQCKYCGAKIKINGSTLKNFIVPIRGFVTDKTNKETRKITPTKSYASEIRYVGQETSQLLAPFNIGNSIKVSQFKNEELLVLNENNFYTCPKCGYTVLDRKYMATKMVKGHEDFKGDPCDGVLERTHFGYTYKTDVVKLQFLDSQNMKDKECALSTLYALLEGISNYYAIERTDIGGVIFRNNSLLPYELILFDTVTGGAGYVKLLNSKDEVLNALYSAKQVVSHDCCDPDTSCYNCLRNFYNQKVHGSLKRGKALATINEILGNIDKNEKNSISIAHIACDYPKLSSLIEDGAFDEEVSKILKPVIDCEDNPDFYQLSGYKIKLVNNGDNSHPFKATLYWEDAKVLLFIPDLFDDYEFAKNNQTIFKCYLLDDTFDFIEFLTNIRKGN